MLRYRSRLPLFLFLGGDRGPRDLERRRSLGSRCLPRLDGLYDLLLLRCLRLLGDLDRESRLFDLEDDSLDDVVDFLPEVVKVLVIFVQVWHQCLKQNCAHCLQIYLLGSIESSVPGGPDDNKLWPSIKRRSVATSMLEKNSSSNFFCFPIARCPLKSIKGCLGTSLCNLIAYVYSNRIVSVR